MTTQIEMTKPVEAPHSPLRSLLWVGPAAIVASSLANLALYAAAGALFPEVTAWSGASVGQIIGANSFYLFIGALLFLLVARISSRPALHYRIVATLGLILSLGLPLAASFGYAAPGAPPASLATVLTLSLMHVVTYAISLPLFIRNIHPRN